MKSEQSRGVRFISIPGDAESVLMVLGDDFPVRIDRSDLPRVCKHRWYCQGEYVFTQSRVNGKKIPLYLHRYLLYAPDETQVDHINGDPRDNRQSNLRLCTQSQNLHNTAKCKRATSSRFKGVYLDKQSNRWRADIMVNRNRIHIGTFSDEEGAARAYASVACEHLGEFGAPNGREVTQ